MEDGRENSESVQFHSIDSEISFQRIKDLPKKSKYFGAHKRLSWMCERDIQKFAKDAKLLIVELERSQTFYKQKLKTLNDVKRKLRNSRNENVRCKSYFNFEEVSLKLPSQLMIRRFTMPALSKTVLVKNSLKVQTDF